VALTVVAVALATAQAGEAGKRYRATGRPGIAVMPIIQSWWGGYERNHTLRFSRIAVTRSSASRSTQTICVQYRLYHFVPSSLGEAPSWMLSGAQRTCRLARPGAVPYFPATFFTPVAQKAYAGEIAVTWSAGGRQLGSARWYAERSDYRCQTIRCSTDVGYRNVAYIIIEF
jgi:hypothetical protein